MPGPTYSYDLVGQVAGVGAGFVFQVQIAT